MSSMQLYAISGFWRSSNKNEWRFISDKEKCGRLITLQSSSTLQGLKTMVFEDYNISQNAFDVEFSYLPSGLIGSLECSPIIVSNDRQVRNLVGYLRKDPSVRLCVTVDFNIIEPLIPDSCALAPDLDYSNPVEVVRWLVSEKKKDRTMMGKILRYVSNMGHQSNVHEPSTSRGGRCASQDDEEEED